MAALLREFRAFGTVRAGARGRFVLALAGTQTSDREGISAAGVSAEARRATPAVDAEALVLGHPVGGPLPVSPAGIVSPVVITRAALRFLECQIVVVDCGTFLRPAVECETVGQLVGQCISTGAALPLAAVQKLFEAGTALGHRLSAGAEYLIVGECVPGGTTTAMALLTAFGHDVRMLLSSSMPAANHEARFALVREGLARSGLTRDDCRFDPLRAVAAVGDPMQPVVAGMALSAARRVPVMLAGGSQMLAVWAFAREMAYSREINFLPERLGVVTTKWVAFDRSADCAQLARLLAVPFAAACPDFATSRHAGLRAYEDGHVKEGVGAGGAVAAAHLVAQASEPELMGALDVTYDQMVYG
jgi:uncharacterized protein (TIGR00303 family)